MISMVLIFGLSVVAFGFSSTQFLGFSEVNTEFSDSVVEFEKLSGEEGVRVRVLEKTRNTNLYLMTPEDKIELKDAGSVKSVRDGAGEYSVISVKDGSQLNLESKVIDTIEPVRFDMGIDSISVGSSGEKIEATLVRTYGTKTVKFDKFNISSLSSSGDIGPARGGVEIHNSDYTSSVTFGEEYNLKGSTGYKDGSVDLTIRNTNKEIRTITSLPSKEFADLLLNVETEGGSEFTAYMGVVA